MDFFANFIPRWCVCCGSFGADFCPGCYQQLEYLPQATFSLDVPTSFIEQAWAVCPFTGIAKEMVVALKYQLYRAAAPAIGELIFQKVPLPVAECLVPIPLHRQRRLERGFNQSELIGRYLSQRWQMPLQHLLLKQRKTLPQAELLREQRLSNVSGVFQITQRVDMQSVCLLDDVSTTGTTLNEAAKVLQAAGVKKVYAVVFAHGK